MKKPLLNQIRRVHCVGIGGIGVSALARLLKARGVTVTGSDAMASSTTRELAHDGVSVLIGHHPEAVTRAVDLVVFSEAIPAGDLERKRARTLGVPQHSYPEALAFFLQGKRTIAVCGTHGKSTVTALFGSALVDGGLDPTVVVGTKVPAFSGHNMRAGKGELACMEACEYRKAFLQYRPAVIVLLNVEPDHLDYYGTFTKYLRAFQTFVARLPADGLCIANGDDPQVRNIVAHTKARVVWFAMRRGAEYTLSANNVVCHREKVLGLLRLRVPGQHNRMNALAAFAAAHALGISASTILRTLHAFRGTWRRLEFLGEHQGVRFFDDYAHHPTEIRASLQALREQFPKARLRCVFQPHQHSRTKQLLPKFVRAFADASEVIVPNIYAARDTARDRLAMSAERFVQALSRHHANVHFGRGLAETGRFLRASSRPHDVVVTMGAGDVSEIGRAML